MEMSMGRNGDQTSLQNGYALSELTRHCDMLHFLPIAAIICDMAGFIKGYNDEAACLWGRRPDLDQSSERYSGAHKLYQADGNYLPHDKSPVATCIQDGLPWKDVEIIIERPDHSRIHVRANVAALRNEKGRQVGVINCLYDVTVQQEVEKELRIKSLELEDYIDNANIGLHRVDADGVIVWANQAELDMLGYTADEYVGHHISEFHVSQEKINDILTQLHEDRSLNQYESELHCKDGSVKTVHISSSVFRDGGKFIHTRCFTVDVTEQKMLYRALAESESRYRSLVNSLPVAVYTCNKEGRITFFNEFAVGLWGYRPDIADESLKYCACYKVRVDGKYIPPDQTPMAAALRTGQSFRNIEAMVERPDGSNFYASVNIDPLFDEENNISGAINVFQDISKLKSAEVSYQESEGRYRELIHSLNAPLYVTDADGKITLFNKAAADLWGREPVIGEEMWCGSYKILSTDGSILPLDNCPMAVCLREQQAVIGAEVLVVRPDGSLRNVVPYPQPIFDGQKKMLGAINMLIDITELKDQEKALRESEEKYRSLVGTLEIKVAEKLTELKKSEERYHKMVEEVEDYAIILLDKDGIICNWNKGAEKIKGYTEAEIVGRSFQEFYMPEDQQNGLPMMLLNEAREKGKAIHEGWRKRSNGRAFWGSIVLTALHDEKNKIIGFSKVTRDLTERKLAEDRMREYLQKLEFQNRELEQFVYVASHDLKEPLRKIRLYNSFIAEDPSNVLHPKSTEYLNRSINASERMKRLIDDLLAYSRASGNVEGLDEVDLNMVVDEIIAFCGEEFDEKKVSINKRDLAFIKAVPFQIKQLLTNLIDNAVKYKHPDRDPVIRISAELVNGNMLAEYRADSGKQYHKISVIDNGIGFDTRYAGKIFEIFQRLDPSAEVKGSGIGLSICNKIAQNHNGFIHAEGREGQGASFFIYIPQD